MEELSTTQIAARIGRSERTAQRYIASGKLKAVPLANNRYAVESADLEALLLPTVTPTPADSEVRARLEEVEHEVDNLQRRVAALESRQYVQREQDSRIPIPPSYAPRIEPQRETQPSLKIGRPLGSGVIRVPDDLPEGTMPVYLFAENHQVNGRTLRDQITKGIRGERVEAIERENVSRPGEHERYFTPAQQRACILFWQRHGTRFVQCEQCPHVDS